MSNLATPHKVLTRSAGKSHASERSTSRKPRSSVTPRSASRSVKLSKRKFFTVAEDLQILDFFKKHQRNQSVQQMAAELADRIKHSEDSVRDRIRRVLSKLRLVDRLLLAEESRVLRSN